MEKFTSPWAVAAEDEEKFERTVSSVGRLLRDDLHLQALYHMLVMLSPGARNSPEVKVSFEDKVVILCLFGIVKYKQRL